MDLKKTIDPKESSKFQKDPKDLKDAKDGASDQASSDPASSQADKLKQFEGEGVTLKAKLIGSELVLEPRGDKMCQNSIQRLKAIIKGTYSHKKRIVLKISYSGVKVFDEKTNEMLHHHEVPEISYIASDDTDTRCFGYVCDVPGKLHQFICFKTTGPAVQVMSVISALFEAVLEKKENSEKQQKQESTGEQKSSGKSFESRDLISDSGIVDGDSSFASTALGQQTSALSSASGKPSSSADLLFDDLFSGLSTPVIVDKDNSMVTYGGIQQQSSQEQPLGIQRPRPSNLSDVSQPIAMPTALPRPSSIVPNRSLVYNHSSASLGDGANLSRQSSFASPPAGSLQTSTPQQQSSSQGVDKYSVFNEIDNLPSIFESASLANADKTESSASGNNQTPSGPTPQSYQQQLRNGLMLGQRSFSSANMAPLAGQQTQMGQFGTQQQQQQQQLIMQQQQQPLVGSYPNQQAIFQMNPQMSMQMQMPMQQQMGGNQQQTHMFVNQQQQSRQQQFAALNHQLNSSMGAQWDSGAIGSLGTSLGNPQAIHLAAANRMFSQSFNHDQRGSSAGAFAGAGLGGGPPSGPPPQLPPQLQRQQSMQMQGGDQQSYQQKQPPQQQQPQQAEQPASGSLMFKQKNPFDDDFFA